MNFLETEDVVKQYANHLALDKVSIQVPEGKVFGLLGPNGAGKTTLIRIINRITAPDSGLVRFNGREFQPEDIYQIGYLPEERGLYKKMKVGEQAIYLAQLKGLSYQEARIRLIRWFEKFDIMPWWNKKLEELCALRQRCTGANRMQRAGVLYGGIPMLYVSIIYYMIHQEKHRRIFPASRSGGTLGGARTRIFCARGGRRRPKRKTAEILFLRFCL